MYTLILKMVYNKSLTHTYLSRKGDQKSVFPFKRLYSVLITVIYANELLGFI